MDNCWSSGGDLKNALVMTIAGAEKLFCFAVEIPDSSNMACWKPWMKMDYREFGDFPS